jgi:microcin C transport system substrate-binding protein
LTRLDDWWARDKKYWKNRYNPDRIQMNIIRETPKVFEAFKRGDIDSFGLNIAEYWYEKLPDSDPDVQAGYIYKSVFYNQKPRPTYGLWINTSRPLLDNRDIREGIQFATNWDLVIEKFFRGDYSRLDTSSDGYGEFSHPTLKARPFDIKLAIVGRTESWLTSRAKDSPSLCQPATRH